MCSPFEKRRPCSVLPFGGAVRVPWCQPVFFLLLLAPLFYFSLFVLEKRRMLDKNPGPVHCCPIGRFACQSISPGNQPGHCFCHCPCRSLAQRRDCTAALFACTAARLGLLVARPANTLPRPRRNNRTPLRARLSKGH